MFIKSVQLKAVFTNIFNLTVKTGQAFLSRVVNNFIIANLISGIISIIWLLDERCKILIKPEFKTRILMGLLLTSSARLA